MAKLQDGKGQLYNCVSAQVPLLEKGFAFLWMYWNFKFLMIYISATIANKIAKGEREHLELPVGFTDDPLLKS